MKYLLLLPLASSSSVLAAVVIALPIGAGRYAAAFLLGLVQAGAIVLAARDDKPEKSLPIQYYGQDIRGYDARSRVTALPVGWEIREEPPKPYEPDDRTKARLFRLLCSVTENGKAIPREGVHLRYSLLKQYGIKRPEAERLCAYVAERVGYKTNNGETYIRHTKARAFMGRMWKEKGVN